MKSKRNMAAYEWNVLKMHTLREKCPYSEFFWPVFFHILCTSPYSVRMRKNTDQKNSEYGNLESQVEIFLILTVTPANNCRSNVNNRNTKNMMRNMFKFNNKNNWTTSMTSFCYFWTCVTPFSYVFIVDFVQVNVCWGRESFYGNKMNLEFSGKNKSKPCKPL